ncbi:fhkD [Symbiodinium pilosum]|uniref:FhkD protein n=1 Tax=Symbiodinium pilosum TaxID=2952 RepID=A0A812XJX9_SYMPI|nr:fhkD [Symbiodinium pilosum]
MGIAQSVDDAYFQQKVKLGQGGFGTVWRAVDRKTDQFVAVKQIDKLQSYWQGAKRAEIQLEIDILRACNHENITKLYNYYEESRTISIVLEYCDGGDLDDKLKEQGWQLREADASAWTRQICAAIAHLHSKEICHRDIKPGNFMIASGLLKLSDFGFATFLAKGEKTTEDVGTPAYMAPEQHLLKKGSKGYGHSVDVWAAGCTLHMLVSGGRHPFIKLKNAKQVLDMDKLYAGTLDFGASMLGGLVGGAFQPATVEARSLCQRMVCPDAEKRLSAEEVLKDKWLNRASQEANLNVPNLSEQGYANHFRKLQQQLAVAEKQLKDAEERELSLKSRLQSQDNSVMVVTIPLTLPECMNRCYSCTSCSKAGPEHRINIDRVLK